MVFNIPKSFARDWLVTLRLHCWNPFHLPGPSQSNSKANQQPGKNPTCHKQHVILPTQILMI